jgi:predicted  nucleic acid-binding Zn-ribbon protein
MAQRTNGVKELHRLHLQLREVQEQLERGPRQLRARQQITLQKQTDLENARQALKSAKIAVDQKNLQLKSCENKLGELKGKLNGATSNREYDALRKEIDADEMAKSVLEDEIIAALEKVDAAQIAIKKVELDFAAAQAEEKRFGAEQGASEAPLRNRLTELETAVTAAETCLPPDAATMYRRLVQKHGADALAQVDGNICSACYVALPPQLMVQLNAGQIIFCKTCGRLVYPAGEDA